MAEETTNMTISKNWMDEYDRKLKEQGLAPLYERTLTPTLQTAPDSSTHSYTKDGKTYPFKIGDEVRVPDAENGEEETNGYVYYKLYDLTEENGTAVAYWAPASAGGSGGGYAKIGVTLNAVRNGSSILSTALNGATVTLYRNDGTSDTIVGAAKTWAGATLTFTKIPVLIDANLSYKLVVTLASGQTYNIYEGSTLLTNGTRSGIRPQMGDELAYTFDCRQKAYTVAVESNQGTQDDVLTGKKVTYGGTAYNAGDTIYVPDNVTVTANDLTVTADDGGQYKASVSVSGTTVTALYQTCAVTFQPTVSDDDATVLSGITGTVNDQSVNYGDTVKVPYDTSVAIACDQLEGYATPVYAGTTAASPSLAPELQYQTVHYAVSITSNQGEDAAISDAWLRATYEYNSQPVNKQVTGGIVKVPAGVTPVISASSNVAGYSKQASVDTESHTLSVIYSTTLVYLQASSSRGAVDDAMIAALSGFTVNQTAITQNDNTSFVKVPTGDAISVSAPSASNYSTTVSGGGTATGTRQTVSVLYTYGVLVVEVTMSDADDTALAGVAASISVNGGEATAMQGTVDASSHKKTFQASLDEGDTYTVSFGPVEGYQTPAAVSGTKQSGVETKTGNQYQTTVYIVGIQTTVDGSVQGANVSGAEISVNYTGGTAQAKTSGQTVKVPANLTPTATPTAVEGYSTTTPSVTNNGDGTGTISFQYQTVTYTLSITSNQTGDDFSSDTATLAYTYLGETVTKQNVQQGTVYVPASATNVVFAAADKAGYAKTVSGASISYATCKLSVSLASDTGEADLSGVTVTVRDTTAAAAVSKTGDYYLIPGGHEYSVAGSDNVEGYAAPDAQTGTAGSGTDATVAITLTYEEVTMETGYIILDQTSSDPTQKVIDEQGHTYSGYQRPAVIDAIRAASHCYVGTFANGKMTLKQLDDTDGTKYADGTSAASDIATVGKDVFMRLPFFFTRVSEYATDKVKIEFAFDPNQTATTTAQPDGSGWKQWGGNDLIGKYEAYETDSKTYSSSGKDSTGSVSQANFKSHARARGTGFTIVKWRHQNLMAILFYAYYGHTNCQSLIGSGASSNNKQTGLKNSLGMTDTTSANGNTDNIVFWGLENWWGNKYEWVDNVGANNPTWTITEDDGTTRTVTVTSSVNGWVYPKKFVLGDNLDVVAAPGESGGSDSQGYCDGQYHSSSTSRVVARSDNYAGADGGVADVNASYGSSGTNANYGSRLAFTGTIEIA